ncbi:unnamed protein product, partial [Ixodes persulcatus]
MTSSESEAILKVSRRLRHRLLTPLLMAMVLGPVASASSPWAVELGDVWWKTSCHTGPSGLPSPCWRPNGLFPDESDCCSFYSCASCRAYRVRCALGTVFDRRLGLCNHPHAAPTCLAPNPGEPCRFRWRGKRY